MVNKLPKLHNEDSKVLWLLDSGHGIETSGKRSPVWDNDTQLMEYAFNRDMSELIWKKARKEGLQVQFLNQGLEDMPLKERCAIESKLAEKYNTVTISNHANAANSEQASGMEGFTSVGDTGSDEVAEYLLRRLFRKFVGVKKRTDESDGDLDKEAHFYILRNTKGKAVLLEYGFMTNEAECMWLLDPCWRATAAETVVRGMIDYENSLK